MAKHALKILQCEHRKMIKVVWPIYNIMRERVKGKNLTAKVFIWHFHGISDVINLNCDDFHSIFGSTPKQ